MFTLIASSTSAQATKPNRDFCSKWLAKPPKTRRSQREKSIFLQHLLHLLKLLHHFNPMFEMQKQSESKAL